MVEARIARTTRRSTLAVAAALVLSVVSAVSAEAQDVQTFPGSSCQASGSTQDLYYSGVLVANRTNSTKSAVCPLVRSNGTAGWLQIVVFVRDRHSRLNISCTALARDRTGVAGTGWSDAVLGWRRRPDDRLPCTGNRPAGLRTLRGHLRTTSHGGGEPTLVDRLHFTRGRRAVDSSSVESVITTHRGTETLRQRFQGLLGASNASV